MAKKKASHHGRHHLTHAQEVKGGHDSHRGHHGHHVMHHKEHGHHSPHHMGHGHSHGHHERVHGVRDSEEEGYGSEKAGASTMGREYYGAGHGDFANMPREVRMERYPKDSYGVSIEYADNFDKIDEIEGGSNRNMRKQLSKEMY